jgi:hypothetical protein
VDSLDTVLVVLATVNGLVGYQRVDDDALARVLLDVFQQVLLRNLILVLLEHLLCNQALRNGQQVLGQVIADVFLRVSV